MRLLAAVACGAVFALGLVVADMTSPARVLAFLDVGGRWDATLGFVMAGAIAVYAPIGHLVRGRRVLHRPTETAIEVRLVAGSILFGIGWGLSGYCPGPALVAAGTGMPEALVFVAALVAGIAVARRLRR